MEIPWRKWYRVRPRHITWVIKRGWQHLVESLFRPIARRRIRREFPGSTFVGPYEQDGVYMSFREEQWLWTHRDLVRGVVLDMSTPRYWHEWIYQLPTVEKVLISDLWTVEVGKYGHQSKVDITGDFAAQKLPVPEESFDTVLCLSILEHCTEPATMVRNIGLILRPGGVAFFWCPYAYIDGHTGDQGPDYWRFCRDGYLVMARKANLEVLVWCLNDDFTMSYGGNDCKDESETQH